MTEFQLLGTLVGLIGGFAGLISVVLQARSYYVDAPRIEVKCTYAFNPSDGKQFYSVEVINKGSKPITLNNLGISFQNKMHSPFGFYFGNDRIGNQMPYRIDSHSAQTWLFGKDATISAIKEFDIKPKFRAYVDLATGKKVTSKKMKIKGI